MTDTPYRFQIFSSQNFLDLSKTYLFTEFRIRKYNAQNQLINLEADDNVAPIQLIGQTFINNIKMSINGRETFNSNSLMAYKTYFSHELSFSSQAKESHLNAAGYYGDKGLVLESGDGFDARKTLFTGSRTAQFMSRLDIDLCCQPLMLINHVEILIEIMPNASDFLLIAPAAGNKRYVFEVLNCQLFIKKVELLDSLSLDIEKKLSVKPARYCVRKTLMKSLFISPGRYSFNANLFMDQIPRRITLGLVSNADFVGALGRSCFNFQPFSGQVIPRLKLP